MDDSNSSTSCPGALEPEEMSRLITANVTFSVFGSLFSLLAIVLILLIRACGSSFVYRLLLYLAISTLCLEVSIGLQSLPIDSDAFRNGSGAGVYTVRKGWGSFCTAIAYVYQTVFFMHVITVAWICIYVFVLAIFKVALKEPKHHVAGVCCVLVTPFSISWIPFAFHRYGFSPKSYVCWIVDDCADGMHGGPMKGHLLQLLVSTLPAACILGVGLGLLCLVTVTFRRRLGEHKLRHQYWMALREIKPLLIYPTVSCAIAILGCCFHIYMMSDPHSKPAVISLASSGLFQVLTVVLPISLFCHPGYKKKAGARLKFLLTVESKFTLANSTTAKAEEQVKILS